MTVELTAPAGNLDAQCHLFVASVIPAGWWRPAVDPDRVGAIIVPVPKA